MVAAAQVTRFFITGEIRAGAGILQATFAEKHGVACHANLLHQDIIVRRQVHEAYFGVEDDTRDEEGPWITRDTNVSRYLSRYLWSQVPLQNETAVGLMVPYHRVRELELYDTIEEIAEEGRFIHVQRNPVACFVSLLQARRANVWRLRRREPLLPHVSVMIDPEEITEFVAQHEVMKVRLRSRKAVVVRYADILQNFPAVILRLCDVLNLPMRGAASPPTPIMGRKRIADRVFNWDAVKNLVICR